MEIIGTILVIILIVFLLVMAIFDPLEKYDKTLDDPDHKISGTYTDYVYGRMPTRVSGKVYTKKIHPRHAHEEAAPVDEVEQFISDHRLPLYHQTMLIRKDAVKFLYLLKKHKKKLYGFDGFHLRKDISPKAIQIDQSYSPDYSHDSFEASHDKAVKFFEEHHEEDIGYEFVYEK